MKQLRELIIRDTGITEHGVATLQQALPDCRIHRFDGAEDTSFPKLR